MHYIWMQFDSSRTIINLIHSDYKEIICHWINEGFLVVNLFNMSDANLNTESQDEVGPGSGSLMIANTSPLTAAWWRREPGCRVDSGMVLRE